MNSVTAEDGENAPQN